MENEMTGPTSPESVRQIVNDFMNRQELLGNNSLMFRLEYRCDYEDDDELEGSLVLTQYLLSDSINGYTDISVLRNGIEQYRYEVLQEPCVLRISEEGLAPLGVWNWKFSDGTLTYLGD